MSIVKVVNFIGKVRKALVAGVGVAALVLGPNSVALHDAIAILTALGVYVTPNA